VENVWKRIKLCEFSVLLQNKMVFKDAVYAKAGRNHVTVKDVLGASKVFKNCKIVEVDVNSERLVLSTENSS